MCTGNMVDNMTWLKMLPEQSNFEDVQRSKKVLPEMNSKYSIELQKKMSESATNARNRFEDGRNKRF